MFYLFLYYNNFSVSLCRYVAFFRETLETLETLCTLFALSVRAFTLILICIQKATTSFDIVAYRKKYYGEIILSPSSSHQVIRND